MLLSTVGQLVELSKEIKKQCIENKITFIDTSNNLIEDINRAYENLRKDS